MPRLPAVQRVGPSPLPVVPFVPQAGSGLAGPLTAHGSKMPVLRAFYKNRNNQVDQRGKKGKLSIMRVIIQKVSASE